MNTASNGSGGSSGSGGSGSGGVGGGSGGSGGTLGSGGNSEGGMAGQAGSPGAEPPPGRAGYIDLEPYYFEAGEELNGLNTASARLFYALVEADASPEDRPLFVFTGGLTDLSAGSLIPGPSTTGMFPMFGVNRVTLNPEDLAAGLVPNQASWTDLGNLLFLDSRLSGFSYSTLEDPETGALRGAQFSSPNFNNFVDAADSVRALLGFFAEHPQFADNPVIFVGQGYAGTRVGLMLGYLLYPERLLADADWAYLDTDLADAILDHYAAVFPDATSPETRAARQFGWQILLQPKVGGDQEGITNGLRCQPGSPELAIADELGETCPPASRDLLHLGKSDAYSLQLRQASRETLTLPSGFESALFIHPSEVVGLPADARAGAFRLASMLAVEGEFPKEPAAWSEVLGPILDHDRYFINDAERLIVGNSYFSDSNPACKLFIESVQYVATFVTNAGLDGRVRTSALPATLEDCDTWLGEPMLESVDADSDAGSGATRPGRLTLNYNAVAAIGAGSRSVRWPSYPQAGHLVSASHPVELKADVQEFLQESGL